MQISILDIRQRLAAPLAWLLALAVLAPASPHLAQGLVLCIGEKHVSVEAPSLAHHDGNQATRSSDAPQGSPLFQDAEMDSQGEQPCMDLPLRIARAGDLCHQAIQSETPGPDDVSPLAQPLAFTGVEDSAEPSPAGHRADAPDVLFSSVSPRLSSTVVLLI